MKWFDGHCDVLCKLYREPTRYSFYDPDTDLDVSYKRMKQANVKIQVFAVFIPAHIPPVDRFQVALKQAALFYEEIIRDGERVQLITSKDQLEKLKEHQIGALLTLEGLDCIQGELEKLRLFYRLGVRQVGLTWNYANEVADGILEPRNGGLTRFGHQVMQEMLRLGMIVDVSHLSERAFWEVLEYEKLPVLASHSNARAICPHPRNLTDEQIQVLISRDGRIGVNFYPPFVAERNPSISHVLRHIEHICELGGENSICFGSDFDGIEIKIPGLENTGCYLTLLKYLKKYYSTKQIEKWAYQNMVRFYQKNLQNH